MVSLLSQTKIARKQYKRIGTYAMKKMSPWGVNPAWQNFSSLFREASSARDAKTGMERSHHLTASLYFGIATLEAFLNERMRAHLKPTMGEEDIFNILHKGKIVSKLKKWPTEI